MPHVQGAGDVGGGSRIQKAVDLAGSKPALKYPLASHSGYQRRSISAGSKLLSSFMDGLGRTVKESL